MKQLKAGDVTTDWGQQKAWYDVTNSKIAGQLPGAKDTVLLDATEVKQLLPQMERDDKIDVIYPANGANPNVFPTIESLVMAPGYKGKLKLNGDLTVTGTFGGTGGTITGAGQFILGVAKGGGRIDGKWNGTTIEGPNGIMVVNSNYRLIIDSAVTLDHRNLVINSGGAVELEGATLTDNAARIDNKSAGIPEDVKLEKGETGGFIMIGNGRQIEDGSRGKNPGKFVNDSNAVMVVKGGTGYSSDTIWIPLDNAGTVSGVGPNLVLKGGGKESGLFQAYDPFLVAFTGQNNGKLQTYVWTTSVRVTVQSTLVSSCSLAELVGCPHG